LKLSPEDLKNGWTPEALDRYRAERDAAASRVAGNVVTQYERPKPPIQAESALKFNPHRWMQR